MKKLILFVAFFAVASAALFVYLQQQELTITLSEEDLEEHLAETFPIERQFLIVVTLGLTDPEVALVEGSDRLHYRMNAWLAVPAVEQPLSGSATVSGKLSFDAGERELYLDQARLEDLDISGVPSQYRTPVSEAANLAVRQHLDRHPVYTLEEEYLAQLPEVIAVRDVRVVEGELHVSFGLAERFWTKLFPTEGGD